MTLILWPGPSAEVFAYHHFARSQGVLGMAWSTFDSSLLLSSRHGEQLEVRLTPLGRARVCAPDRPRMGHDACG